MDGSIRDLNDWYDLTRQVTMKTAAIAELKANLSRFLSRVKAGEEVLVTERNVPVARLVPLRPADDESEDLRDLERQGLVRIGAGGLAKDFWKRPRPKDRKGGVRRAVTQERESGW